MLPADSSEAQGGLRQLLRLFKAEPQGGRSAVQMALYERHALHFKRRVGRLSAMFFPGLEKTQPSLESLSHGAFASFAREPTHDGQPAFEFALRPEIASPTGFLYFWRGSATIHFLQREGPSVFREFTKLRRNVRLHLSEQFVKIARGGETRWALPEWDESRKTAPSPPQLPVVDVRKAGRGKELIRAILSAAEAPLTRSEICLVIERSSGFAREVDQPLRHETQVEFDPWSLVESGIAKTQVEARARSFFQSLSELELHLLRARGFHKPDAKPKSFREVAGQLRPQRSAEYWRTAERSVFERLRDSFEREEMAEEVSSLLIAALEEVSS